MEQLLNEIRVAYLDNEINRNLASIPAEAKDRPYSIHYDQDEELFLELESPYRVPQFPIHHDVRLRDPEEVYIARLRAFLMELTDALPSLFQGLSYFFDPADIIKPCFFRLYKVENAIYLYILRLNLAYRPFESMLVEAGTNDITASYSSKRLFIESEIIPLEEVVWEDGKAAAFRIRQLVSNTWIGETGRGYLVRGIWMDTGLSKFFSKLVFASGSRTYPFYPFFCKYKTICASVPDPRASYRRGVLPLLHRMIEFLGPEMGDIQNSLKNGEFSEKMPLFAELEKKVPASWREVYRGYESQPYLNARDMKEFALEIPYQQL
jgi:hypothetical protein